VGRFIRATRIDELPQLINIIAGDMSIVGPRPERVEHVEKYTQDIPEFAFRLKVKGGLTGVAQVFGKYNTSPLNKLKMDLYYITNYSLLLDLQIIFETVKILVQKESTEGFTKEKQEEMREQEQKDI
jgi:lipopolysaccharide/colanic/teichoic acid biosynthesis glycosyltransferase